MRLTHSKVALFPLRSLARPRALWLSTFHGLASDLLEPSIGSLPAAACSGAIAGGMQALVAAPAENLRVVLEGGQGTSGWSHAWKEVFRGTEPPASVSKADHIKEVREVRTWMKDVKELAGRGWDGWGWGVCKDIVGFAAFFTIFEVTRDVSLQARATCATVVRYIPAKENSRIKHNLPGTVYGISLVTGGVIAGLAYELACRPFDNIRKSIQRDKAAHPEHSSFRAVYELVREEGLWSFMKDPDSTAPSQRSASGRLYTALRTLARVGPWGVGFLVYEAYGGLPVHAY